MKNLLYPIMAILIIVTSIVPVVAATEFSCTDVTEIPKIECEALVALYNNTNGPGWYIKDNWLVTNTPSNWFGLTVASGHVTNIELSENHLNGNHPPELDDLTSLNFLFLAWNQVQGSIIPELGNINSLGYLNLSNNQLSGNIPPELGNLANLGALYLYNNQLSGTLPPELGKLISLQYLSLTSNQLSGNIPPELGNLVNLWVLNLSFNQLTGNLPPELGKLTNLITLGLWNNQLSGNLPIAICDLSNLQNLFLSNNRFSGNLPPEMGNLVKLRELYLNNNYFLGEIPSTFVNLIYLDPPGGTYEGTDGLDLDSNMFIVPSDYPNPNDPLQVFLKQKDPDWQLYQGFKQAIGKGGGDLASLDGKTDILIPAGSLDSNTTFTFVPQPAPHHSPGMFGFAHNSFKLLAEDSGGNPVTAFNLPVTVTLTYTDMDIAGIPEDTLGLYYWDEPGSTWKDAVTTCPGEYTRDLVGNKLTLPLCHLTEFGVFGTPLHIFLPVINR